MHAFTLTHVLCNPVQSFCSNRNGSPDEILSICLAQENQEMYPWTHSGKLSKNEMPGSVRQWTLIALVKKTSLHFDCRKTTDGLARAGYNVTWPVWALEKSQWYCAFINPIELYWIATINKFFNMGCVTFWSPCIWVMCKWKPGSKQLQGWIMADLTESVPLAGKRWSNYTTEIYFDICD
jgi:hypothetical protein